MQCGLLGRKLGHSYSPQIHGLLGSYDYKLFEKEPEEVGDFLKNGDFTGLNVTIPYKKDVIPYLSQLSPVAKRLGAVNTIVRRQDGSLIGHNTDYFGFRYLVERSGLTVRGKKVLVLGSGGASNTAVAVLQELGAQVVIISRSGENNYHNLHLHHDASVIVNTTPVGMYPNTGISPIDLNLFPQLEGVLDAIYNPARTQILLDAEKQGLVAMNGLWMLVAQAKESAEWFTGSVIDQGKIPEIHACLRRQMENIVLIGMPGCGKSTIGKLLAQRTGKKFVDADEALEARLGRKITDIIPQDGEDAFRQMESDTLSELGKQSGLVIATGGGCVTQQRNYPLLHQNGTILWLTRQLHKLPTEGRPLSQPGKLQEMFAQRQSLYRQFADAEISNNGPVEETLTAIRSALGE
ncbi:MAG: shikimate kinase [Firmicutes bacterium]|nr:shikimate kinase [Bacillota bacterium]MDY6161123.1 shikimate kinase [Candidatus Faecousia sp.]